MTAILQETASSRGMITYSDLAKRMKTVVIGHHDTAMNDMLLDVSRKEASAGRGLLSVVVVHKYGDMEPATISMDLLKAWVSTCQTGQHVGFTNSTKCTAIGA